MLEFSKILINECLMLNETFRIQNYPLQISVIVEEINEVGGFNNLLSLP